MLNTKIRLELQIVFGKNIPIFYCKGLRMILTLGFVIFVTYWLAKLFKNKPSGISLALTYFMFFVGVGFLGLAESLFVSYYLETSNTISTEDLPSPSPSDLTRVFLVSGAAAFWVIRSRLSKIKSVEVV